MPPLSNPNFRRAEVAVFWAVSDPTRRRVLDMLFEREMSAGQIAAPFTMSRPAVSQHLRVLSEAGLVSFRRAGRERIYRLQAVPLRKVHDWAGHYQRFWTGKMLALGDYLADPKE
jgi:DNA-binding transcriptional ArsR family regulator